MVLVFDVSATQPSEIGSKRFERSSSLHPCVFGRLRFQLGWLHKAAVLTVWVAEFSCVIATVHKHSPGSKNRKNHWRRFLFGLRMQFQTKNRPYDTSKCLCDKGGFQ